MALRHGLASAPPGQVPMAHAQRTGARSHGVMSLHSHEALMDITFRVKLSAPGGFSLMRTGEQIGGRESMPMNSDLGSLVCFALLVARMERVMLPCGRLSPPRMISPCDVPTEWKSRIDAG